MVEEFCLRARAAFADRAWAEAVDEYALADAAQPLEALDLEQWGLAAFLAGRDEQSDVARERAHHAYERAGDADSAARVAWWLCLALTLRGEPARAAGWLGRMRTVLADAGITDSVWDGFAMLHQGMASLFGGDLATALELQERAVAVADRFADPNLRTLAAHGRGQTLIASGRVVDGLAQLDEVMVAVTTRTDIAPQVVGLVYCAVIDTCRDAFDVQRGREWTEALSRWCATQPELVPYRGQCLVHRSEILQLNGFWPDAMAEVQKVFARFADPHADLAAGMALYQQGELHRLRGETDAAEASYRQALRVGHDPQPGLALLRLAQGQVDAAVAAIRRALDEVRRPAGRLRLLPACVEIALAAGDVDAARVAADELETAAAEVEAPLLAGAALHARGALLLATGHAQEALPALRRAWSAWQDIAAPYEAARSRVLVALACRSLGDEDTAEMELDAARWVLDQLGAAPELARLDALTRRTDRAAVPGGLTLRELQVLRLVATGATNRSIAEQLFLSEKTVARHVANIFTKLDVSSRAAATAFAYERGLV